MTKKIERIDALIFIDTNILLDFYRIRRSDVSLKYLELMVEHKDLLIITSQIEMEYKKNRQSAILESIKEINKINNVNVNVPAIITDVKAVDMIKKQIKEIEKQQKRLKDKIEKILKNPSQNDYVYKKLQKVFNHKSDYNLNRENKLRFKIRRLAMKRFILGYPPRKAKDNSIGDSVNWEWIIKCAVSSKKHIIIVTRDTDYGVIYDNESYINDWLKLEFQQRVSIKRKLILTDKLSKAFQLVKIPVTKDMIEEEEKVIRSSNKLELKEFQIVFKKFLNDWENINEHIDINKKEH